MQQLSTLLANVGDMALKRRARRIIEELDLHDGDKVLDVGCGDGFYLHLLANLPIKLQLTGVDFDKPGLDSAKNNLKGKKVSIIQADLMKKLPFRSNTFDKIIMTEVAEHLPNDLKGLKEVYRVLKKKGIVLITVPNHNYPFLWDPINKILELAIGTHIKKGFWAGIWNQHIRLYYPKDILSVVKKAGFKVALTENVTHYSLPFNHNLLNYAALMLHSGKLDPGLATAISKYSISNKRKEFNFTNIAFALVNTLDRLNDNCTDKSSVSVLVKSTK